MYVTCHALWTTEQQAYQCQQSHLMELWLNKQFIQDTSGSTLTECWPTDMWKLQQKVQERSVSPEGYSCKEYWTTPPLPTVPNVVLSVTDYGMAQTNLLNLDRVQNEAKRVILGTTEDTPTETKRFMIQLYPMQTRQKMEQLKTYFSAIENPHSPFRKAMKDTQGMQTGMGQVLNGSSRGLNTASMPADRV